MQQVAIDPAAGREWLEKSLAQGFDISAAVRTAAPFDEGNLRSFLASGKSPRANFAEGGVASARASQACLAEYLDELSGRGAACVIVENDLALRMDPVADSRPLPTAYIGDRVIHWCDLGTEDGARCVDIVNRGASGYPLNAFVTTRSPSDLGLVNDQEVTKEVASQIAGSLVAVVVSVFDDETFLIWDRN